LPKCINLKLMKTTVEKSTHASPTSVHLKPVQPYFAKAGGGDFFAPSRQSVPASVQTKLNVNKPGDRFEQEADSTAERVMRMASAGKKESQPSRLHKEKIQRKETSLPETEENSNSGTRDSAFSTTAETESAIRSKTSGGQPMSDETRNFMEHRFGNDFGRVRIHHDSSAAQLSQQLHARAFTYQNHIFFGQGQFQPHSSEGKHLLAHELTHVVQQGASKGLETLKEPTKEQTSGSIQAKPSQTGTQIIQRGILDAVAAGAGAVAGIFDRIVSNVSRVIGTGISAAAGWIQGVAGHIGSGLENAWAFVNGIAGRIGSGLQASWNLIRNIASRISQTVTSAWGWIQNIAARIGMGITSAWSWVQNAAARLGLTDTLAWSWVQMLASRIGRTITNAWNWVENVAIRIGRTLTTAWDWVQQVAGIINQAVTAAWGWVQRIANRLGMMVSNAWTWVQNMASRLGLAIISAWTWAVSMASRIGMIITSAWQFLVNIAARILNTVLRVWEILQHMASQLRMAIITAWNWAISMATRIGLAIVSAWNRIISIARQIGLAILSAWNWLLSVGARIGKVVLSAWNWVKNLAVRLGRAIVAAWNWIAHIAVSIAKRITEAFNWLVSLAKRLMRSLADAWDWYLHAPDIEIETDIEAPDGSGKSRKKVGVGEHVTFTGSKSGEWKATGGTPLVLAGSATFVWTAPTRGSSVTISLTSGRYTRTVIMSVLEPASIQGRKASDMSFRRGRLGAGMQLRFHYLPKTVSFGNVDSKEVSGPATNVQGYFEGRTGPFQHHNSGDAFLAIQNNNEDSVLDSAGFWGYPSPWRRGGYDWVIPNHFKVRTEAGDGKKFTEVTQAHSIEGTDGSAKTAKAGAEAERSP